MITDWRRADMFEHANRLEPQPDPLVRTHRPVAVWAVHFGGYDFSGIVAFAARRKLGQLANLSARTGRNLCLWLVHRCARVELLCTEGMGMSTLTSIDRLIPASTTVIKPSSDHSAPCLIHSPMSEISGNALCGFWTRFGVVVSITGIYWVNKTDVSPPGTLVRAESIQPLE